MRLTTKVRRYWRVVILGTLIGFGVFSPTTHAITVIGHASVDRNELQLKEVRAIFTMKKRLWSDGQRVQVYVLSQDQKTHKAFCKQVLGIFPRQLDAIWQRLVYSGTGQAPTALSSKEEMIQTIANTPGAIGYIQQDYDHENIKAIRVH